MTPERTAERRYLAVSAPDGTWTVVDHTAPHTYTQVCAVVAPDQPDDLPGTAAGRRAHHLAAALNAMPEATP